MNTASSETPETYNDVLAMLSRTNAVGTLPHSFLIQSDSARLRNDFALELARLGRCSAPENGRACGKCSSCRQLSDNNKVGLIELFPRGKAYQIKIGDADNPEPNTLRDFLHQISLTDISGARRKVGIIYDADRMNAASQNALLKTLEEPPPATMILLVSANAEALLPTTRSRCRLIHLTENFRTYDFPGAPEVVSVLTELFFSAGGDPARVENCAGRLIAASSRLRAEAAENMSEEFSARMESAAEQDASFVKQLSEQQEDAASGEYLNERKVFLSAIHTFFAQLALLAAGVPAETLPNAELLPESAPIPDAKKAEKALAAAESLDKVLKFNVSDELALRKFAYEIGF
ncbi:MAG: hypothetical protein PHS41_02695 [Victivallaceae bacterium]|nr:hypothetical protein [Victivallaceae bacterium]